MLSEAVNWEEEEVIPLHYAEDEFRPKKKYKSVHLPKKVTEALAEETGIHISDGNIWEGRVSYAGHAEDDSAYLRYKVRPLLKQVWGIKNVTKKLVKGKQGMSLGFCSKEIANFKEKLLGLPSGKKDEIEIPACIMRSRRLVKGVLRGLFDGDGSLSFKSKWELGHTYPVINYGSISLPLLRQIQQLLRKLGFTVPNKLSDKKDGTFILCINGDTNYERWISTIGFNNPKHLTKVVLYEREGIVPPNTGLRERLKLIRGEVELSDVYPVDKLRVNNNRITEIKVLQKLEHDESHISELGRHYNVDRQCISGALRRLFKMGLVECVQAKKGCKSIYRITQWGLNKLNRVETIVKRLREEFYLPV
ncbi:MAG: LAGLIDADG family homing endonuclease [Promethearchaeota archaeon]